jgi:NAD(P)-dependent dehydrogenase (short-subunit alcohol dehydrogenase family)
MKSPGIEPTDGFLNHRMNASPKTVIITGANSGLGFECARSIASAGGWHIVVDNRTGAKTSAAVDNLRHYECVPHSHKPNITLCGTG